MNAVLLTKEGRGGGGLFLVCKDYSGRFAESFPVCPFFFFNVEIRSYAPFPLFQAKDQSAMLQLAETTEDKSSLMSCT